MAPLVLSVFGALQVSLTDGSIARFESDKTCALLVHLAVESDRPHRRDALTGLLWPNEPEQTARHNLRQALFSLRQTIGDPIAQPPYLHITRHEIQFNVASNVALDLASFNGQLAACASHVHARLDACAVCAPRLQQAVGLYRGKFLQEFFLEDCAEYETWALTRREALHQRALDALTNLATYYEQRGDPERARIYALRQLELDPWREQAHRQLMRVFVLEGQRGAALVQYETCRRVLAEELGVEPSSETRELYGEILAGRSRPDGGRWTSPQPAAVPPPSIQPKLPTQLTPFIGRERELAELGRLIADPGCRCITLVGPGGMGKTRLALQVASTHCDAFAQGVAFVPLAVIDAYDAIVPAIAEVLGFTFYGTTSPRAQLFNHLCDRQMLLVLDNVEQLLSADPPHPNAAELFIEILQQTTAIKLLLTSREPLNMQGEWVFEVEGLQIPESEGTEAIDSTAAVALFLQRAQRARVGFSLRAEERAAVARLCRLVDGTPLALELAATWVRTLSVSDIVREIERNLDFLSTSVRDLPERHRSIRAVFDHSWKLLTAEERRVLGDLSAFHGRFRREAAEQVTGASLSTLSALVAKSLVRRTATGHYELHELVRQYAASKLAAEDLARSVAERHSRYYLAWLHLCAVRLQDHRQKDAVTELAAELDNIRAAWDWAVTYDDIAHACQVATTLLYLFELRTWFAEGEIVFRHAAETIQSRAAEFESGNAVLSAINAMRAHSAYFAFRLGKSAAAYAALSPCVQFLQSSPDQFAGTYALWYLGMVSWELGMFAEANASLQAGLAKAQACGARWYETMDVEYLGIVAHDQGEYEQARRHLMQALAKAREMGDPMVISHVLGYLSLTTLALGATEETEKVLRESLALAREIGYRSGIGNALDRLGLLAQGEHPDEARALFASSLEVFRENGDLRNVARVLNHRGFVALALGDFAEAQESFTAVLRLARAGGYIPFALDALAGLAVLWAKNSNTERALELVMHILQHPAAAHEAKLRARQLHAELESRLTPDQLQATRTLAEKQSSDMVIAQALSWTLAI